jgi:peptidoglycan/LPS O-acetylase OafA/YrhL
LRGQRAYDPEMAIDQGVAAWLPNGAAGVELFFFISGYILAYPFLLGQAPSLRNFYARRLTRLEPPYLLIVLTCFLMLTVSGYQPQNATAFYKSATPLWQSALASMGYLHGVLFSAPPRVNPPLWSLEIEIQFYLIAPLLFAAYRRIGHGLRVPVGWTVIFFAVIAQVFCVKIDPWLHWTVLSHAFPFLLGIVICDHAIRDNIFSQPKHSIFDIGFTIGVVFLLLSGALFYPSQGSIIFEMTTLAIRLVAILLLYFGSARGPYASRLLSLPWITLVGGACYSLYLTHVPIFQAASVIFRFIEPPSLAVGWLMGSILLLPPTIVMGLIFYVFVERPCMSKDWFRHLTTRSFRGHDA